MKWMNLFFIGATFISSGKSCKPDKPCPEDIICSMVFKSITVEILDSNGNAVQLDEAEVSSKHFNQKLDAVVESPSGGPYIIVDDSYMKFLSADDAREVQFSGWLNDSLVVREVFLIRHDCCHVVLVEGPEEITLE